MLKPSAPLTDALCQTLNTIYRRAGIDGATSHSSKRSFITTLVRKGIGARDRLNMTRVEP
jgi:integrase/recombinase XerD